MTVLHWFAVTAPAWFWHHATHIKTGSLSGTWLGDVIMFLLWTGYGLLFAAYAVAVLLVAGFLLLGVVKLLGATRRAFMTGYRKSAAR